METEALDKSEGNSYDTAKRIDDVALDRYRLFAVEVIEGVLADLEGNEQESAKAWLLHPERSSAWLELVGLDHQAVVDQLRKRGLL